MSVYTCVSTPHFGISLVPFELNPELLTPHTGDMPAVEDATGVHVGRQGAAGLVRRCTCLSAAVRGWADDVSPGRQPICCFSLVRPQSR